MSDQSSWTSPRVSPDGNFRIAIEMYEAFNSHWVLLPTLEDSAGNVLLTLDRGWSMDESKWTADSVVELTLRKYPGNHTPVDLVATIDCVARLARVGQGEMRPLNALEANLGAALTWNYAKPEPPPPNVLERIQRFLRGE